jgi:hypothetical protein
VITGPHATDDRRERRRKTGRCGYRYNCPDGERLVEHETGGRRTGRAPRTGSYPHRKQTERGVHALYVNVGKDETARVRVIVGPEAELPRFV